MATSSVGGSDTQRNNHTKGTLDADRQRRLEELPGWTWDPIADQWEEGFSRLLHYVERHGDARVPQSYTVDGYRLGQWVNAQRGKHAKGTLDADRQRRLEELPGWTWDPLAAKWEEGFSRLLHYVERHGDARVPQRPTPSMATGSVWVRRNATGAARHLDADRQHRLEDLPGWTWDTLATGGDQWEEGFSRLLDYVKRHGDARVPRVLHGRWLPARYVGQHATPNPHQRHP